jgi:hypothetical protein
MSNTTHTDASLPFEKLLRLADLEKQALDEVIAIVRRHHAAQVIDRAVNVDVTQRCTFH